MWSTIYLIHFTLLNHGCTFSLFHLFHNMTLLKLHTLQLLANIVMRVFMHLLWIHYFAYNKILCNTSKKNVCTVCMWQPSCDRLILACPAQLQTQPIVLVTNHDCLYKQTDLFPSCCWFKHMVFPTCQLCMHLVTLQNLIKFFISFCFVAPVINLKQQCKINNLAMFSTFSLCVVPTVQ